MGGTGSCPLVGKAMLRKTLNSLSADGWGCVPARLVVWPEASQHWSLQAVGWGQVLGRKGWPPGGPTSMSTLQNYRCQFLCPCSEPQLPPASARHPPILAGRSGPVSHKTTAFFPESWLHTRPCVYPPRVKFLFPPVLWNSCDQTPLAFKTGFSGGSSSQFQIPRLGSLK